jgi:hypothetical protein
VTISLWLVSEAYKMGRSNEEKDLADKVRGLRAENSRLREERTELEAQVLTYEYRLGIKSRPPQEITLNGYLTRLNNQNTKGNTIKEGKESGFILTNARVTGFGFKRDWIFFLHYLYVDVSDNEGNNVRLIHWCSKKYQPVFNEILTPYVGNVPPVIVESTSTRYHFIDGIVQDDKELRFDNL